MLVSDKDKKTKSYAMSLVFLGWLVYTVSYFGKVNYSANITQIIEFYGVSRAQAGTVPTFFFFAYGVGQVINGLFCKKYNMRWMVFISLLVSGTVNLIIAKSTNFAIIKWLWLMNGFTLSVLWPTLIRLLSECVPLKKLGASSVVMGTSVATGTLIIYGLSALFVFFGKFKFSFYTAAVSDFIVATIWMLLFGRIVKNAKKERVAEMKNIRPETGKVIESHNVESKTNMLYVIIGVMCFCAIGVNLIKDGLLTWVPSILKDEFSMSDSISILLTLFLPVLAVFGNAFSVAVHKKVTDYVNHLGIFFTGIALMVGLIIASMQMKIVVAMLIGLVAASFLASSLNSLVTSIFPLFMRGKVNSGLIAGVLNGFCCLGTTISSYGLGKIADNFGWIYVFFTLLGVSGLILCVWLIYNVLKHFMK